MPDEPKFARVDEKSSVENGVRVFFGSCIFTLPNFSPSVVRNWELACGAINRSFAKAKEGTISKEWALQAISGCHSLCGDAVFFCEAEKIIDARVAKAVAAERERVLRFFTEDINNIGTWHDCCRANIDRIAAAIRSQEGKT
jgi:hypothetical protein